MDPRTFDNVAELWSWEPANDHHSSQIRPIEELRAGPTPLHHPQLLVCHDFKGGSAGCSRWEGSSVADCSPFLFTRWWHIDTFCYFGRKMVTIPPPSFTSLAHRHGVKVIGTVLFEQGPGRASLSRVLSTEQTTQRTIDILVQIMQTWRFDGWVMDVEVALPRHDVSLLINFLRKLTAATKRANPRATILWYDAVCTDGELEWQNTLNNRNREFYDACDGIFTNYAWTDENLEECNSSRGAASVCVGTNFDYGNFESGECKATVSKVFGKGLSVALVPPSEAVETEESSVRFWSSLSPVMNTRPLDFFPFKTTFRNGFRQNGKYFRLRDMDLMPNLAHSKGLLIPTERGLKIKEKGTHLLWVTKNMRSNRDLRVKIRVEGPGSVTIKLDRREMLLDRTNEDGTMELRPMTGECRPFKMIYVVTSEPDTVLTYFEAFEVDLDRCLE